MSRSRGQKQEKWDKFVDEITYKYPSLESQYRQELVKGIELGEADAKSDIKDGYMVGESMGKYLEDHSLFSLSEIAKKHYNEYPLQTPIKD